MPTEQPSGDAQIKIKELFTPRMILSYPPAFVAGVVIANTYIPTVSYIGGIVAVLLFMGGRLVDPSKLPMGGTDGE